MDRMIETGEADTRADIITRAMTIFFDRMDYGARAELIALLSSEEGKELIRAALKTG